MQLFTNMFIDVARNFQAECGTRDADKFSKPLQLTHQQLWNKPLPNGKMFDLACISQNRLCHASALGEFYLSSDRAINTFATWKKIAHITSQIPKHELNEFENLTETIGAIMIWPSNRVDGKRTINGERGFNNKIADRLDLTIECIRRYYAGQSSPLYDTLARYESFFGLFGSFKDYVDFFLLQDAVSEDYSSVIVAKPFDDFASASTPKSTEEYRDYMVKTMNFIRLRNARIDRYQGIDSK